VSKQPQPTRWSVLWFLWILAFLGIELPAAMREKDWTQRTLSVNVWARYAPHWYQRIWFAVFGFEVFVLHFMDKGQHWWSSGWAVIGTGVPVAVLILSREREMLKKVFGKIVGGLKVAVKFVASNGPLLSSAVLGVSAAFPGSGVAKTIAGIVVGFLNGGAVGPDSELATAITAVVVQVLGTLSALGSARKTYAKVQAKKAPAPVQ
jgi:hypothetical protein